MAERPQPAFGVGEVSPLLHSRSDLARYIVACKTLRNFIVMPQGGIQRRPGLKIVAITLSGLGPARLIPFEYNYQQNYALEFGDLYFRVLKDGSAVLHPAVTVTGITQANPGVVTAVAHGYANGDWVKFDNTVVGMTQVNGKSYIVGGVTANTFTLNDFGGTTNTTGYGAYVSGGTVSRYATITTTYIDDDLPRIKKAQSADVMRVTHPTYPVREIVRGAAGHYAFSIGNVTFTPQIAAPTEILTNQDYAIAISAAGGVAGAAFPQATEEVRLTLTPRDQVLNPGDRIFISGITGATQLNNDWWIVSRVDATGVNNYVWIVRTTGALINTAAFTAYVSGGVVATRDRTNYRVTTVSPDGEESLSAEGFLAYANDPRKTAPITVKWKPPTLSGGAAGQPDPANKTFNVFKEKNGIYGFVGRKDTVTRTAVGISNISSANPGIVTTAAAHGLSRGDRILMYGLATTGAPDLAKFNGETLEVGATPTTTTFELYNLASRTIDTTAFGAYVAAATDNVIVSDYWFADTDVAPDLNDPAPPTEAKNPFAAAGDYPGCSCFHEQRWIAARTNNDIQRVWATQAGNIYNFNVGRPSVDSDAIEFTLPGRQANEIRHMIPLTDLFMLTSGTEWVCSTGDFAFAAQNIRNRIHSDNGVADYPAPIAVANTVLYVHATGDTIWDMAYQFDSQSYKGEDRTMFASHLFDGKRIIDWAYQQHPHRILWCVLDDGTLAAMTYVPEQGIYAWSRHDTDGAFESVCVVREGDVDGVYFVVSRRILGATLRVVERLDNSGFDDARDAFFVDCGASYDTPFAISAATAANPVRVTSAAHGLASGDLIDISDVEGMTAINGRWRAGVITSTTLDLVAQNPTSNVNISGITQANPAVVTSTAHGLPNGNVVRITGVSGMTQVNNLLFRVAGVTANTFQLNTMAAAAVDSTAYGAYTSGGIAWSHGYVNGTAFDAYESGGELRAAVTSVSGLDHLDGQSVSVLADGTDVGAHTVASGAISLAVAASRVHVGLPYTSQMETLDIRDPKGSMSGVKTTAPKAVLWMHKSREGKIGTSEDDLVNIIDRAEEGYDEETLLQTGEKVLAVPAGWNKNGRIFLQQDAPLPMSVLSMTTKFEPGFKP